MPFHVHILQKSKVCIIHKDTPFSEKWQNNHGNVVRGPKSLLILCDIVLYTHNYYTFSNKDISETRRPILNKLCHPDQRGGGYIVFGTNPVGVGVSDNVGVGSCQSSNGDLVTFT